MSAAFPAWAWIAFTLAAASLQAFRTAAQKWLGGSLSTAAATYVRYLFALPVAAGWALILSAGFGVETPLPGAASFGYAAANAATQIAGTAFLLKALQSRNFAVGVAYSKTDVVQAAAFEALVLGAAITWGAAAGIAIATLAVMLMSLKSGARPLEALISGVTEKAAVYGLLSGASFAISGVMVRAAVLNYGPQAPLAGAAVSALLTVLSLQVVFMGLYLLWREPGAFAAIGRSWKAAAFAGAAGGIGSICWFLALGLQQVAYVRTLGLVEILATIAISRLMFKEHPRTRELAGIFILLIGIALVLNAG